MASSILAVTRTISDRREAGGETAPFLCGRSAARGRVNACAKLLALFAVWALAGGALADAPPADWRTAVHELAERHFRHPAWGLSHCERDYALARELAARDHVAIDDDVLYAAAFLHDMAAFAPWEKPAEDHADVAAGLVGDFLKRAGFPMKKLGAVQGAIRTHMFDREPEGPEALYLHDADALDWLGAIGIARIVALVDPNGGSPTGPEVIPMLEENLAKVPARVLSPAGRALVPDRRHSLETFLGELRAQSGDLKRL